LLNNLNPDFAVEIYMAIRYFWETLKKGFYSIQVAKVGVEKYKQAAKAYPVNRILIN
jgi:hypothetical protein